MKKFIILALALIMVLSLAACKIPSVNDIINSAINEAMASQPPASTPTPNWGNWPNNEFTALLPTPNFETSFATTSETAFEALVGATVEQLREYAEAVKDKGFTIGAETSDETFFGITTFQYKAKNSAGYEVDISYALGLGAITLTKPSN